MPRRIYFVLLAASVGCYSGLRDDAVGGDDDTTSASEGGGASESGDVPPTAIPPAPSPLRRLTRAEYDNTVRDLLGTQTTPSASFPAEDIGTGFTNNAGAQSISGLLIEAYESAAADLATEAVVDLPGLLGCDPASAGLDACMQSFLPAFGLRAFRRPLDDDELARWLDFSRALATTYDDTTAVRLVVQGVLQSPHFLYRVETGGEAIGTAQTVDDEGNPIDVVIRRPTGYQMAARLSYLLWATMPDDTLLQAAQAGELDTAEGIEMHARRMLDDPRAKAPLSTFLDEWLFILDSNKLTKSASMFPDFTEEVRALLAEEHDRFVADVIDARDLVALFAGSYSFMNAELAAYYGVSGPAGDAFERVELDPDRSAGLLTQGAFLAANAKSNQSSPIARGNFVLARLVCQAVPPPPPGIPPLPEPEDLPDLSTRERLEMFHLEGSCASCHKTMDEVGFLFEHYDADGRWRDEDVGKPIDSVVQLDGIAGLVGNYQGAPDFLRALATSEPLRACVARQWFRFGTGRIESVDDTDTITALQDRFDAAPDDVDELIIALTQSDAFLYRTDEVTE